MNSKMLIGLLFGVHLWAFSAAAQEQGAPIVDLTYQGALELARENAPVLRTVRARVLEADSQVGSASVWRFNPQLSGSVGSRFGAEGGTVVDWSVGVQQWLEIGGQRGDRVLAARQAAVASAARSEDTQRLVLRDVSNAFIAVLFWEKRFALHEENLRISEDVARIAKRRYEVGDAGGLERSASVLAVVRARSELDLSSASLSQAVTHLKVLLGIESRARLVCRGDLRQLGIPDAVERDAVERPDLRALGADIREAEAEAELGRAGGVPNLALGAEYSREESADIVTGTLSFDLPIFDRGQGPTAVAEARGDRLRSELDAARYAASLEVDTAQALVQSLASAVRRFEQEGLQTLERSEQLAAASYETGAIPLGELLAIRRELVGARLDYVQLLRGAATARIELAASTGAFR